MTFKQRNHILSYIQIKKWAFDLIMKNINLWLFLRESGVFQLILCHFEVLISSRLQESLLIYLTSASWPAFFYLWRCGDTEYPRTTRVLTPTRRWESSVLAQVKSDYCVSKQPCLHTSMSNKAPKRVKIASDVAVQRILRPQPPGYPPAAWCLTSRSFKRH